MCSHPLLCRGVAGKHYLLTDLAQAREGILASLQQSRGGKLFLEG